MTAKPPPTRRLGLKRIFVVDDHPIVRQGLAKLLSDEADLELCGEAENARDGLQAIGQLKPDLAIVDISLAGKTGLDLIKDIRVLYPQLPVLVLSMHDELIYAERALRAGARGYVMKQEGGKILLQAIRQVLSGQVYVAQQISATILDRVSQGPAKAARSPVENLTEREFEVFHLIGRGLSTRQIANQLSVSVKTVEVHRLHIKEKLHLEAGAALMHYAMSWESSKV